MSRTWARLAAGKRPRHWGRRAYLALLLAAMFLVPADDLNLSPARAVGWPHVFSIPAWEAANIPRKWLNLLGEALPWNSHSREERLAALDEYLILARSAKKEQDRLEGVPPGRAAALGLGGARAAAALQQHLDELLAAKGAIRAMAEEALEAEVSAAVIEAGLGSRLGLLFPPVDIRFDQPPTLLVTSRRDRIQLLETVLLSPDLRGLERDGLERKAQADYDLSALVDDLSGLGVYPNLVNDLDTLRSAAQTAAHEWLHAYLFFRPLGFNYWVSEEMFTINETIADLAGRELGDAAFARMGGDLSESASRYLPAEDRDPRFTQMMRETRLRAEELLAEGKIEEAEAYMKERWWMLRLGGYGIRKLNQAFFAFRGRYAQGAASVSPVGAQVKGLRAQYPDVGSFLRAVAGVGSPREFLELLKRKAVETPATGGG